MSPLPINIFGANERLIQPLAGAGPTPASESFGKARERMAGEANPGLAAPSSQLPATAPIANTPPAAAVELFKPRVEQTAQSLSTLNSRVSDIQQPTVSGPLRNRLEQLDHQFRQMGANLNLKGQAADPIRLLRLQNEVYQLAEDVELFSKAVDQATNGVKSILQTQV